MIVLWRKLLTLVVSFKVQINIFLDLRRWLALFVLLVPVCIFQGEVMQCCGCDVKDKSSLSHSLVPAMEIQPEYAGADGAAREKVFRGTGDAEACRSYCSLRTWVDGLQPGWEGDYGLWPKTPVPRIQFAFLCSLFYRGFRARQLLMTMQCLSTPLFCGVIENCPSQA